MSDKVRRGLRTALQVALSALSGGALKGILAIFGVGLTAEAYAAFVLTWTPIVTVLYNALEDKTGKAILVPKATPVDAVAQGVVPDIGQTTAEGDDLVRRATTGGDSAVPFNGDPAAEQFTFRAPDGETSVHPPIGDSIAGVSNYQPDPIGDPMGNDYQPGQNQTIVGGAVPPFTSNDTFMIRRTRRQLIKLNRAQLRDELEVLGAPPLPARASKGELVDAVFVAERRRR